jgi:hypothetical protein
MYRFRSLDVLNSPIYDGINVAFSVAGSASCWSKVLPCSVSQGKEKLIEGM